MTSEIRPGAAIPPEYSEQELEEFLQLREGVLEYGFDDCLVKLPTKEWHGVRVEAFIDPETQPDLPFIPRPPQPGDQLMVSTLSGIGFDIEIGPKGESVLYRTDVEGIIIDEELKQHMTRMALLGRNLAYEGFGFPEEHPWILPIEHVDEPNVLCADNACRRLDEIVDKELAARANYWRELGWGYHPEYEWPEYDRSAGVTVSKFTEFDAAEGSLKNVVASVTCDTDGKIRGGIYPDYAPSSSIDPTEVLDLEELGQLQEHARIEFKEGVLSDAYQRLHKAGRYREDHS